MRLAAEGNMVDELGEVRGMHDAYEFVKKKSPWIGPNVSLIYQLLEWERLLAAQTSHLPQIISSSNNSSDGSSVSTPMHRGFSTEVESEEDWSRRRAELEALEEAEELDRDMEERMKRSRTTSASSTLSSSSSGGGPGPASVSTGGRKPFGIKRRISGSSLASEITLEEEEDEAGEEEGSESSETRTPPPLSGVEHSESDAMMVEGIVEETNGAQSTEDMEVAGVSQKSTKLSAPPFGGRAERKRSSTLSFVPSLDPLPSSPTTITDPSSSNPSGSAAVMDPPTPRISLLPRSKSYQNHAQRASLSSLDEIAPSSPLISSFTSATFDQPPTRSETPSSMASSSRRSSLTSFPRPPPILSSNNEPRSLQQLLFFPPSPNRSMDPSTPTMAHSTSIFLSSPAPTHQTFASSSSSSSFGYQLASTSPITERTPTGVQRLRSMIPPIISPTTALLPDDTPLAHVFGSLGGGLGGGGFGSRHSPKQRKDLHRKTFSLDVKSLFSSAASPSPSDPLPPAPSAAGPSFSPPKRTRAPSAGVLGGFVFGGGGGRHSRTPSISSVTSGGSATSSRRSSVNGGGGMMPTPSTPTCVVTEFNARGFVLDTREMK
ncbi:hypothetical protein BDY24DRAFT_390207 [Mrakia frigida]|uniref:uncharacterized protein n=1 Tax=Mrakia frigida TaxID=29902 RepID=UPI003FCC0E62